MSILECMLKKGHGVNTNAKGILSKEKFLYTLELAANSGVSATDNPSWENVRKRFGNKSTGEQSKEILMIWDQAYNYQQNN